MDADERAKELLAGALKLADQPKREKTSTLALLLLAVQKLGEFRVSHATIAAWREMTDRLELVEETDYLTDERVYKVVKR